MGQVPDYCIIGQGRLGRHLVKYFSLLGVEVCTWSRSEPVASLVNCLSAVKYALLCVPDDQIETVITANADSFSGSWVHFSGVLETPLAIGVHPLMTFGPDYYSLAEYIEIPLVLSAELPEGLLSEWPNSRYAIPASKKSLYHAWCVLAGNGSSLLWQQFVCFLGDELSLPKDIVLPFARRCLENVLSQPELALTGPLVRGDSGTIEKHNQALSNRSEHMLYKSMLEFFEGVNV